MKETRRYGHGIDLPKQSLDKRDGSYREFVKSLCNLSDQRQQQEQTATSKGLLLPSFANVFDYWSFIEAIW